MSDRTTPITRRQEIALVTGRERPHPRPRARGGAQRRLLIGSRRGDDQAAGIIEGGPRSRRF